MRSFMQPLYHKPHKGGHSIPPPIPILLPTRYNRKTAPATFDKPRLTPVNARTLPVCSFPRSAWECRGAAPRLVGVYTSSAQGRGAPSLHHAAERRDEPSRIGGTEMTTEVTPTLPPDTLNEIGVLKRREIEARIIGPIVEALAQEFDRERVLAIVAETIINVARKQGAERADAMGDDSLIAFDHSAGDWRKGNALEIEVLEQNEDRYDFNVTRCRYAEMYRSLDMAELGAVLSCNRDYSLVEGFNPEIQLERKQTIMQGAPCCTFRYSKQTAI